MQEANAGISSALPYGALLIVTLLSSFVVDAARERRVRSTSCALPSLALRISASVKLISGLSACA